MWFEIVHVPENMEEQHHSFEVVVADGFPHPARDTFTLLRKESIIE
jgi:hypothetical protein